MTLGIGVCVRMFCMSGLQDFNWLGKEQVIKIIVIVLCNNVSHRPT